MLCYTCIVYLFFCHGCQYIPQTQISILFIMQFFTSFTICVTLGPGILHSHCSPTPSICVFPLGEGITVFTHVRQWAKTRYCVFFNWCVFRYLAHTLLSLLGFTTRWVFWLMGYRVLLCFSWCLNVFQEITVMGVDQKLMYSNNNYSQH